MNIKIALIIPLIFFVENLFAQEIILDKGFESIKLGISESAANDDIGFSGKLVSREEFLNAESQLRDLTQSPESKIGFETCHIYKHIMPIPVTKIFVKNSKVVMVEISSFPDFTRPICLESKTSEGLKFWAPESDMIKIYGKEIMTMSK